MSNDDEPVDEITLAALHERGLTKKDILYGSKVRIGDTLVPISELPDSGIARELLRGHGLHEPGTDTPTCECVKQEDLEWALDALCYYDPRGIQFKRLYGDDKAYNDENPPTPPRLDGCLCDNCYYGRDRLAMIILRQWTQGQRVLEKITTEHKVDWANQFWAMQELAMFKAERASKG